MTFKSKSDRTFRVFMTLAIVLVSLATLWPVVFELFYMEEPDMTAVWIMVFLFLLSVGFLIWISLDIEYTFKDDYLFVRGGPFRSKIPYDEITKVNPTSNILVGYRILSSKNALEIHYKKSLMGNVIISPGKQDEFLKVLFEKAPNIHFMK